MTDENIRIAVAEAMGWERRYGKMADKTALVPGLQIIYFRNHSLGIQNWRGEPPPDYPNDLNACAEFERTLPDGQFVDYAAYLCQIQSFTLELSKAWLRATARQRCEAFLRTVGKWEESA